MNVSPDIEKNTYKLSRAWWLTFEAEADGSPLSSRQPGLYSEFQSSQSYRERPCLKKQATKSSHILSTMAGKVSLRAFQGVTGPHPSKTPGQNTENSFEKSEMSVLRFGVDQNLSPAGVTGRCVRVGEISFLLAPLSRLTFQTWLRNLLCGCQTLCLTKPQTQRWRTAHLGLAMFRGGACPSFRCSRR